MTAFLKRFVAPFFVFMVLYVAVARYARIYDGTEDVTRGAFIVGFLVWPLVWFSEWIVRKVWK